MSSILAEAPDGNAIVIDIPKSISAPPGLILRSTAPFTEPLSLPEPKNHEPINLELETQHSARLPSLHSALSSLPKLNNYCYPRITSASPSAEAELDFHGNTSLLSLPSDPQIISTPDKISDLSDIYGHVVVNTTTSWKTLTITYPQPSKKFFLPPQSSFLLAPVPSSLPSEPRLNLPQFDFLLLDPPWPNRSASRKGDYSTIDRREIIPLLKKIPVADITKPRGLVAVWITNRPALRKQLLEQVAPTWGCDGIPEAEWTWVKVTEKGETVWDMESKMRKPYEVLLILRRNGEKGEKEVKVKNMVMVAVPEKHSRKPAVKGELSKKDYKRRV